MLPLQGLPPRYTARPIDPSADLADVLDLCVAVAMHEYGSPDVDERMIREAWNLPSMEIGRDTMFVLDAESRPAALAEYYDGEAEHVAPFLFYRVRPDLADGAVADAALAWGLERGRQNLPLAVPGARVAMVTGVASVNAGTIGALERNGWQRDRINWTMEVDLAVADLPPPDWPSGIEVRTADLEADAPAIHAVESDAFSDHYGYLAQPYDEWLHFRTRFMRAEPDLWFLAMDGDEIAGMALCSSHRVGQPDLGWVSTLGVRRPWRKRGLGLAILRHAFRELAARGKPRAGLGVDSQSLTGATRLYEKAGMRVVRQHFDYETVLRQGRDLRTVSLG
jgi:ribosomal protein S18 acetylase RimI-like enzyme